MSIIAKMAFIAAFLLIGYPARAEMRVIDGDSLVIDGERIRIFGLDCPELREPGGPLAKRTMQMLLADKTLTLKRRGRDKYGRTVAKVFADDRDVTCQMIRARVCREFMKYSSGEYQECSR